MIVTIVLMGFILGTVDIDDLINSFKSVNLLYLILIYSTLSLTTLLCSYKWMLLLRAQAISCIPFSRLLALYFIGAFFNSFLPTEVGGDVVRSYEVGKTSGKHLESLAAVAMDRLTGFSMLIFYGMLGLFLNWSLAHELKLTYIVLGVCVIIVTLITLLVNRSFGRWFKKLISFQQLQKIVDKLHSLYEAFYLYKKNVAVLLKVMVISAVFQFYTIWFTYALMQCLSIDLSFSKMILVVPVITILGMLPITISGIGVREGAFVYIFSHMGIPPAQSLVLALLYRFALIFYALIGGVVYASTSLTKK